MSLFVNIFHSLFQKFFSILIIVWLFTGLAYGQRLEEKHSSTLSRPVEVDLSICHPKEGERCAAVGNPIAYRYVGYSQFFWTIQNVIQNFGLSVNPDTYKDSKRNCTKSNSSEGLTNNEFWTDFIEFDEKFQKATGIDRKDLGLAASNAHLIYQFQILGCIRRITFDFEHYVASISGLINIETLRGFPLVTGIELEMSLVMRKRGIKGSFILETDYYYSKPLLDYISAQIEGKVKSLVPRYKRDNLGLLS